MNHEQDEPSLAHLHLAFEKRGFQSLALRVGTRDGDLQALLSKQESRTCKSSLRFLVPMVILWGDTLRWQLDWTEWKTTMMDLPQFVISALEVMAFLFLFVVGTGILALIVRRCQPM